jgi:hypothetical protein
MTTLSIQRRMTEAFIADDPTTIVLIPTQRTLQSSGDRTASDGPPRLPQVFKLIPMTFDQRPTVTADGVERIISYTILGTYDSIMELWDHWKDGEDTFVIVAFTDGHGYEKKGLVERRLPGR